ncbi:hypothetical protein ACF0H5_021279 [Mactra antiquata]
MALQVHIDETNCGPLCQHPSCWQSNTRQDKGFPKLRTRPPTPPDIELDLPTLKVCNMLDDYGEDSRDLFPSKFGGKPAHERIDRYGMLQQPIRTQSIKVTRAPQTSPKSNTTNGVPVAAPSKFKVVEVQEVFDPEDLRGTWDDTFVPKSYYVWVPNSKKKRRRRKQEKLAQESGMTKLKGKGSVKFKDMTEDMVPKDIENSRITARKKRSGAKSPPSMNHGYLMSPRTTRGSSRMDFDQEGYEPFVSREISISIPSRISGWRTPGHVVQSSISELLDLPRDVLIQVLQNTRQSDLMSREKIREIIKRFMPPTMERGNTNISMASQDLLQQKKLNLHEGNKNIRQSHLMETKPVFHLDDDVIDDDEEIDEDIQRGPSPYGSLKDLYFGAGSSKEFNKYKKPLPAITGGGRAVSAGDVLSTKIPSISLGLPELPSGVRQTRPFTYSKKADLDFTLAPVPTPPTSVRSLETPGSDHGTTIRVNLPSQASIHSDHHSDGMERKADSPARSGQEPLHAVSPTFSTRVPNAPATTPATYSVSPTKSAPLIRDLTGSMATTPQEWAGREKQNSPLQIIRAPVNTPGSLMQDNTGLVTIHENGHKEEDDTPLPVSRGRSVRFEIPEVPPPPSSPQLSDDGRKEMASRNMVTVNTNIPQETPTTNSTKPMSGATIRTDANTVNTSTLQAENSFVRSMTGPIREVSMISSPEPWPQINEADYDVAPLPTPASTTHDTPQTIRIETDTKTPDFDNQSRNAREEIENADDKKVGEKERNEDFINRTPEEQTDTVKKIVEESRKDSSPAPPPPSPEAKEDSEIIINKSTNVMETVQEETEGQGASDDEVSMTVTQIAPKGSGGRKSIHRQIDTFQNIDIPASFDLGNKPAPKLLPEPSTMTIPEEHEPTPDQDDKSNRDVAPSVQSTLANRTISERAQSEVSSSVIEPAISQASQGPALSEDFSEKRDGDGEVFADWSGVIVGSDGQDTQAMLSSDKQDMTEEGGDHEGFKEDLRQEFEKIKSEIESTTNDDSELS